MQNQLALICRESANSDKCEQKTINQSLPMAASITDVGCTRTLNEDALYCGENLWLVADGMGGHACGDVASRLTVETIVDEFVHSGNLEIVIESAHQKLLQFANNNPLHRGMGTTIVAMTGIESGFEIAWVGDSRAYLWAAQSQSLISLTTDHSLVAGLLQRGIITPEQAIVHPQRNLITRCLGGNSSSCLKVDSIEGQWQREDKILLCSDGLTDEVSEQQISAILQGSGSNEQHLAQMLKQAKAAGGHDNISAILVDAPMSKNDSLWQKFRVL